MGKKNSTPASQQASVYRELQQLVPSIPASIPQRPSKVTSPNKNYHFPTRTKNSALDDAASKSTCNTVIQQQLLQLRTLSSGLQNHSKRSSYKINLLLQLDTLSSQASQQTHQRFDPNVLKYPCGVIRSGLSFHTASRQSRMSARHPHKIFASWHSYPERN